MTQKEHIEEICKKHPNATIVSSLGTISNDLEVIPHMRKILIKGAMGAALGCGLGYALSSGKETIVIIGDGSFLMSMGAMATILAHSPVNLRVIIMNNRSYGSCGGQKTHFEAIKNYLPWMFEVYEL